MIKNAFTYFNRGFVVVILIGLIIMSATHYLLFHTLVELFSIAVAWCIFMIAWNSRQWLRNTYFLVVGIAYLFVSGLDLVHTLAYKGMPLFPGFDANLPTQLWIAARFMESLSLGAALVLMRRPVNPEKLFSIYAGVFIGVMLAVFGGVFPDCFTEGRGLTPFKIVSEYVICAVLIAVAALMWKRRAMFEKNILRLIFASILLTMGAELAFTFYVSVYGLSNLIGHLFKLGSFILIYLALVESGLRAPFRLLFRELKQYETIVVSIPDPISFVDRAYVYQTVNEMYSKYAKRPQQEIIGMSVADLLGKEVFETFLKPLLDRCFAGEQVHFRKWFQFSDGAPKFMDVGYYPIFDDAGEVMGAAVNGRDMTYFKKSEDALRESEARFRSMFENHNAVMLLIDPVTGQIISANRASEQFYGHTDGEFTGMTIFQINQLTQPEIQREMLDAASEKRNYFVYKHRLADGRIRDVEVHSSPIPFKGKNLLFSVIHDITKRKRVEEALRKSEERFKSLFRNSPLGIGVVDKKGHLINCNHALSKMVGYTREELTQKNFSDFTHPDDLEKEWQLIQEMWKQKSDSYQMEKRYIHKDGFFIWVYVSAAIIIEEGEMTFGFAFVEDITQRKQAEEQLRRYSESLEEMVADRTRELVKAQEELLVKERLAVLGHFAGSISHELRNPLAAIEGSAFFLKMKLRQADDKLHEHLGYITANVNKSTAIIQSLLNLSQMEKPKTVKTNLADVVWETLASSKIPQSVEVLRNIPQQAIMVDIEVEQIRMVLKNIVRNAVQAMDETGELTIAAQQTEAGQVELTIADTGPGIAPEHLEKVFEPLFSTKTHGIGFGLSITKMIVENHGGSIRAETAPASGALFIIVLPIAEKGGDN